MYLKDILSDNIINRLSDNEKMIDIKRISIDIEDICEGDLFFDLKGNKNLNTIFKKGALYVVRLGKSGKSSKALSVKNVRREYALSCKKFYNSCCDKMKIIGITGTNGKTSTVKLIADILKNCGKKVGVIGTVGCEFLQQKFDTGFTTPDPHILHSIFNKMYRQKIEYVVMEVSAHAIALEKLAGIKYEIIGLTNITQDHLDFFGTMENYSLTKLSFLAKENTRQCVVNMDDEYVRNYIENINIPVITYGLYNPSDVFAIDINSNFNGSSFVCNCLDEVFIIKTKLVGEYNVQNILCAISIVKLLGISTQKMVDGIYHSEPEVGRLNFINYSDINIIIDFAHTPDGLKKVLETIKPLCCGKLSLVFGCGGNRDKGKRKIMGEIASIYADEIYLTSDNPRWENPVEIISEIEKGISISNYVIEENRKVAIQKALSNCQKNDCLIIAGKGGEKYQEIEGMKIPYNDFDEVYNFFRTNIKIIEKVLV